MKRFLVVTSVLFFIVVIFLGRLYWKGELADIAEKAKKQLGEPSIANADTVDAESGDSKKNQDNKDQKEKKASSSKKVDGDIDKLSDNLSDSLKEKVQAAYENGKSVKLVLAGDREVEKLSPLLQSKLNEAYGSKVFSVVPVNFKDNNSLDIYRQSLYDSINEQDPDAVILDALLFNDDVGKLSTRDATHVPVLIGNEIAGDATYMVMPPNPVTYLDKISDWEDELHTEVENSGYIYLDHTDRWPSSGLDSYLDADGKYPNDKGYELWASWLADYFTGEDIKE